MLQLIPEDLANQRNRTPPVRGAAKQPLLQTIPGPTQEWASLSLQVVGLSESNKGLNYVLCGCWIGTIFLWVNFLEASFLHTSQTKKVTTARMWCNNQVGPCLCGNQLIKEL